MHIGKTFRGLETPSVVQSTLSLEHAQQDTSKRLGVAVIAALLEALIAGLLYFLRGRKERRIAETPQTVTLLVPRRESPAGQTRI